MEKEIVPHIQYLEKFPFDVQRAWHINRLYESNWYNNRPSPPNEYRYWRDRLNKSPVYNGWRTSVFKRDNYTCQKCGDSTGGNLQAHHIKHVWTHPYLIFDINNGITLCEDCHGECHDIKGENYRSEKWTAPITASFDDMDIRYLYATGDYASVHHIKPFKQYPYLVIIVGNGITLCEDCHIKHHNIRSDQRLYIPLRQR
jgi:5-methylcytosine-specific restriction endonuclease McrA